MMLPFFLVVYAGIYWMYGHYMGRQQAMLRARSCTWAYAAAGCQDPASYKACLTAPGAGEPPEPRQPDEPIVSSGAEKPPPEGSEPADPALQGEARKNEVGNSKVGDVMNKFESVPILGDALHYLFGTPIYGKAKQLVRFSSTARISSADAVTIAGEYSTLCNSVPKDWKKVAKDIFCGFMNDKFPGCP